MTHPLANPKSSHRDALEALAEHPGYQLFQTRLAQELARAIGELQRAVGLQEAGRAQGACLTIERVIALRKLMITEIDEELSKDAEADRARETYEMFYGKPQQ